MIINWILQSVTVGRVGDNFLDITECYMWEIW